MLYKKVADIKCRHVEFNVEDQVWDMLIKDRFSAGDQNKLAARKIGLVKIVEKINANTYRLQLLSHICTSNVFNVKHLFPYHSDNPTSDHLNSRANSFQLGENGAVPEFDTLLTSV